MPAAVAAAFPDGFASAAAGAAEGAGGEDGAGGEKKDAWEKQLLEHCLFRVLGARAGGSPRLSGFALWLTRAAPTADSLMRQAVDSKRSLMEHWGSQVRRLLDATLLLCQQCVHAPQARLRCRAGLTSAAGAR